MKLGLLIVSRQEPEAEKAVSNRASIENIWIGAGETLKYLGRGYEGDEAIGGLASSKRFMKLFLASL